MYGFSPGDWAAIPEKERTIIANAHIRSAAKRAAAAAAASAAEAAAKAAAESTADNSKPTEPATLFRRLQAADRKENNKHRQMQKAKDDVQAAEEALLEAVERKKQAEARYAERLEAYKAVHIEHQELNAQYQLQVGNTANAGEPGLEGIGPQLPGG
jgi:hypothetical protein